MTKKKIVKTSDIHKVLAKWFKANEVYPGAFLMHSVQVETKLIDSKLYIRISKMYEHVIVNYETMKILSDLLKTDCIDIAGQESFEGCPTCDYGSSYEIELVVRNIGVDIKVDSDMLFEERYRYGKNTTFTVPEKQIDSFFKSL